MDNGRKNREGSSRAFDTSKALESSLTTLSWLTTVNVDELRRKQEKEDKVDNYGNKKPCHSYAELIRMAINTSKLKRMTLSEIYEFIETKFPYYKSAGTQWKNSIRHNLSLNEVFEKLPRPRDEPGKGSYWIINPKPPKPNNFRPRNQIRKRPNSVVNEYNSAKKQATDDNSKLSYQEIYEHIFKPYDQHQNMQSLSHKNTTITPNCVRHLPNTPSPISSDNNPQHQAYSPASTYDSKSSVHSNEDNNLLAFSHHPIDQQISENNQHPRELQLRQNYHNQYQGQELPHPLQRNHGTKLECAVQPTQIVSLNSEKTPLHRLLSDPMQWSFDHLKLPESSLKDNPEFQEILKQLKTAESQNWEMDAKLRTNLAVSLSQFMFKNQSESKDIYNSDNEEYPHVEYDGPNFL